MDQEELEGETHQQQDSPAPSGHGDHTTPPQGTPEVEEERNEDDFQGNEEPPGEQPPIGEEPVDHDGQEQPTDEAEAAAQDEDPFGVAAPSPNDDARPSTGGSESGSVSRAATTAEVQLQSRPTTSEIHVDRAPEVSRTPSSARSTGKPPAPPPEPIEIEETSDEKPFGNDPLVLPDSAEVFSELRQKADELFKFHDSESFLDIEAHALEVGEMTMTKDVSAMEEEKDAADDEQQAQWDEEIMNKIDESRSTVTEHQETVRLKHSEIEWRLREEEVAARERLVYEHQAMEASLLNRLKHRTGHLQHVPHDPTSWTIEWAEAPQEFTVNITSLRGLRAKVREGYYVMLLSIVDRIGGRTIRFSTGRSNRDCNAALPPLRYAAKSSLIDFFIDRHVDLLCPASILLRTHACLVFELWQLKVGKYDPTDKVVGWGVWPLVNKDFTVVEGKFKIPMLKGPVDQGVDTFREYTQASKENLSRWLCNCYFEINLRREEHDRTAKEGTAVNLHNLEEGQGTDAHQLRLRQTATDFRSLTVAKLPPRLFFDEVALDNKKSSGLRRRHFGSEDMRPLNNALWEKRALLEEEREALRTDLVRRKSRSFSGEEGDDEEINDWRIRRDLAKMKHTFRKAPSVLDAEDSERDKSRDSHILLGQHHQSIVSQREFFFLGRRYREKAFIARAVVAYDLGVNYGGPWDKTKVVMNVVFLLLGFLFRLYVHNIGLYLWLFFLDVPTTKNSWQVYSVDIRFEFTTRFRPEDTTVTMMIGQSVCVGFFAFFSLAFWALLKVFDRLPYWVTRLMLWMGVTVVFDPIITACYELVQGDIESGETFLLYHQMVREEGSALTGILLTLALFLGLCFIQFVLVYWYIGANHLNGRVNDIYMRLLYPDTSFFMPHDLEVSQTELREVVKLAKNWRTEEGDVKRVNVLQMKYHHTDFFRARLFALLNTFSNDPEQWVSSYIDSIPLRRPFHSRDLIKHDLGRFTLGGDVLNFLRRHFPHLTVTTKYRVGDRPEDFYYEADLVRAVTSHAASVEDDVEMRTLLKSYFTSQIWDEKPCEWDFQDSSKFIIKDAQLVADLIFFETTGSTKRALLLAMELMSSTDHYLSIDHQKPETWGVCQLENFDRTKPLLSTQGEEAQGSIIHILLENPIQETRQLARAFVVTPFGTVVEPNTQSYTCLKHHTADHVEFWARNALELGHEFNTGVEQS